MAKTKVFNIGSALSAGLEETISAAEHYSGELRVDIISLKKIEADPDNPRDFLLNFNDALMGISPSDPDYSRKSRELASLETMVASIKDQGIINPIMVYKCGALYRLIAGERRTLASILAGKSDIQAKILDSKPDALKISILQWAENIERSDLTLWERLRNVEKIVIAYTAHKGTTPNSITVTELSNLIGCSKPYAMNYKAVLTADEQIKTLIQEDQIKNLEKAALITTIQQTDVKQRIVNACLEGIPLKKLKMLADLEIARTTIPKHKNKRGRQSASVNFGATKNISVAKIIVDAMLNHIPGQVSEQLNEINWSDYKSITDTFKGVLKKLEGLHA